MSRNMGNMIQGIALGMAVGAVAYIVSSDSMKRTRRSVKKNAAKAVRNARNLMDEVEFMLR